MDWIITDEARQFLANKDKSKRDKRLSLKEAVQKYVKDGDNIGVAGFVNGRQPIAIVHEIIRQGKKDLTLSYQSAGLAIEYLAGAMVLDESKNSIRRMEFAYWAHEAFGISPLLRYLTETGKLELEDWSNYNMSARFKAGSIGLPFIPCRSPMSDMLQRNRAVNGCPFTGRPIMLLPASHPNGHRSCRKQIFTVTAGSGPFIPVLKCHGLRSHYCYLRTFD